MKKVKMNNLIFKKNIEKMKGNEHIWKKMNTLKKQ